jgi:hypothetical protein
MTRPKARDLLVLVALPAALVLLGTSSAWLYDNAKFLHRFSQGISAYIFNWLGQFAIYLVACWLVLRFRKSTTPAATIITVSVVLIFGAWFRETLVTQPPYLSSDVYRYVWDGRVQAAGINPYRYLPSAPELTHLRDDEIYPYINRREFAQTIYPPFAQMVFLGAQVVADRGVYGFKLAMVFFDAAAVAAIILALLKLGIDPARVILFAWHPLVIWESAHSGHLDSVVVACISAAVLSRVAGKPVATGIALALATLTKFYPALLLPIFALKPAAETDSAVAPGPVRGLISRLDFRTFAAFVIVVVVAYLPYLTVGRGVIGYLPGYFIEEGFVETGSRYFLLALARIALPVPAWVYTAVALIVLGLVVLGMMLSKSRDPLRTFRHSAVLIVLFATLSTPRYSWYLAWLVPFLCFVPSIGWLYLSGAAVLLYLLWLTLDYPNVPLWLAAAIYVPAWFFYWRERRAARIRN